MSGTGTEPKIENKIPSGEIKWRTNDNGKIEITADVKGAEWLDSKMDRKKLVDELKKQLLADKKKDEEEAGFNDTAEDKGPGYDNFGGKKSKKRRNKNKRHTRKNKK
jgi:hypothetical protein